MKFSANPSVYKIIALFVIVLFLFYSALGNYFSHDDFFHFRISQAKNIGDFINYFNLFKPSVNWGYYRPLTTQLVYFIGWKVFDYNPVLMHGLAFVLFSGVVLLVYKLAKELTQNTAIAYLATLYYATSATHFPHLYSIATQELGHALCYLTSILAFIAFLKKLGVIKIGGEVRIYKNSKDPGYKPPEFDE